ncbi:MAG: acetylglutamate kinase [Clostridiales bacterium]|nr:MAG: acetylglutamate kinase [Clostridiales bacterium]
MVLAGKVNKDLVSHLGKHKGKAIGMCGIDADMIMAKKLKSDVDLGFVGDVISVNPKPIQDAIEKSYIPVIATIARGVDGKTYNINADTVASKIAQEVKAENLILMTDIAGLLKDKDDESTLISSMDIKDIPNLEKQGIISGGMIPKIKCCVDAIKSGVKKTCIIDGRVPHSILIELLSNEGIGTQFIQGKNDEI